MGSDWEEFTFDDSSIEIHDGDRGKNYPKKAEFTESGHCLFLNTGNVTKTGFKFASTDFVSKERDELLKKGKLQREDVVLTTRGTVGNVAYFNKSIPYDDIRINSGMVILRCEKDNVLPQYLYLFLRSRLFDLQVEALQSGSAQPQLPIRDIKRIKLKLPPLPEQKAIAHILGSLDDKIELNRQMNETLESMAQALFKSWFVDFDPVIDNALAAGNSIPDVFAERAEQRRELNANTEKSPKSGGVSFNGTENSYQSLFPNEFEFTEEIGWIPKGWKNEKLNELLEVKYGKDHKKLEEGDIPVYGSGGLMRLVNKSLYIGESILIPRKGTLSNLMFVDEEFWTVDTMFFSIPKLKNSAKYLYYQLKKLDFSSMNVGSAVPSMTTKVLNDLNILKPDKGLLKEFDNLISDIFAKKKSLDQENQTLSRLRDTLLPKLLSGELRVPDAEKLA